MQVGKQVFTASKERIALKWYTPNAWVGSISCLFDARGLCIDCRVNDRCILLPGLIAEEILCAFTRRHLKQRAKCWLRGQWLLCQAAVEVFVTLPGRRTILLHSLPWGRYVRCVSPFQ